MGLLAVSAGHASAGLTNDFSATTSVQTCDPFATAPCGAFEPGGITLQSFGSASVGGFNATNGSGAAQINWFHSGFGIYASGAINTISETQGGGGQAYGNFLESIEIPAQQGHAQGEPGILFVPYHLDGNVDIDSGFVDFGWDLSSVGVACGSGPCDDPFAVQVLFSKRWQVDQFSNYSTTINEDVTAPVPFHFGEPLYLSETAILTAWISGTASGGVAAVGHSTADFLHTATMQPSIVQDQSGHVLVDPVIISDTGFDYTNPAAPEPGSALLVVGGLVTVLLARSRH